MPWLIAGNYKQRCSNYCKDWFCFHFATFQYIFVNSSQPPIYFNILQYTSIYFNILQYTSIYSKYKRKDYKCYKNYQFRPIFSIGYFSEEEPLNGLVISSQTSNADPGLVSNHIAVQKTLKRNQRSKGDLSAAR